MGLFENVIPKSNVPDDTQAIGKNGKLVRIAEIDVNILLFDIGRRSRMGRLEAIKSLGVVFSDIEFNTRGIREFISLT